MMGYHLVEEVLDGRTESGGLKNPWRHLSVCSGPATLRLNRVAAVRNVDQRKIRRANFSRKWPSPATLKPDLFR